MVGFTGQPSFIRRAPCKDVIPRDFPGGPVLTLCAPNAGGCITNSMDMNLGLLWEMVRETGKPGVMQSMGSGRVRHNLATEQQQHKAENL